MGVESQARIFAGIVRYYSPNDLLLMLEIYFDDSGTHLEAPISVAAAYLATQERWLALSAEWESTAEREGFTAFHMSTFHASRGEFSDWSHAKRNRVMGELLALIRKYVIYGFSVAIPKREYEETIPTEMRAAIFGQTHYAWAVNNLIARFEAWRRENKSTERVGYFFSEMNKSSEVRAVTEAYMTAVGAGERFGIDRKGFTFASASDIAPLQAADILAWASYRHAQIALRNYSYNAFVATLWNTLNQSSLDAGYFTREQLEDFTRKYREQQAEL